MRIAIPDYVSNSYFPAIAAVELGLFREQGIDASIELRFPVTDAAAALRDGEIDLLAGAAHAPFHVFPDGRGAKLLASLAQNMYWFLVVRSDLDIRRGALDELRNLRIGAAPGPDLGLYQLLADAGIDLDDAGLRIGPVPSRGDSSNVSFGVSAAQALADGTIDAFWANGMGTEVAVRNGVGSVVVDARRDGGPGTLHTFAALMSTEEFVRTRPDDAASAVRAVVRAQQLLQKDPSQATELGTRLFPAQEACLIATLIERDTPYYQPSVREEAVAGLGRLARERGLATNPVGYAEFVATDMAPLWSGA